MSSRLFFSHWFNQLQANYNASTYKVTQLPQTSKKVDDFFELRAKGELKDRVVTDPGIKGRVVVDNVFSIFYPPGGAPRQQALLKWTALLTASKIMLVAAGVGALTGVALSMRGGLYGLIGVAGMIITMASCIFAGNILATYLPADKHMRTWKNPAEDFVARRDADLQRPFPEILKNKCRFATHPQQGTLTDLELLMLWKQHFYHFVTAALTSNPQSEEERLKWLSAVVENNPLAGHFFADELTLLLAPGWEAVRCFQERMDRACAGVFSYEEIRQLFEEILSQRKIKRLCYLTQQSL